MEDPTTPYQISPISATCRLSGAKNLKITQSNLNLRNLNIGVCAAYILPVKNHWARRQK